MKILNAGERDEVMTVEEVRIGSASTLDPATGDAEAGVALELDFTAFDNPALVGRAVFVFSDEQAWNLMCSLIGLHAADGEGDDG